MQGFSIDRKEQAADQASQRQMRALDLSNQLKHLMDGQQVQSRNHVSPLDASNGLLLDRLRFRDAENGSLQPNPSEMRESLSLGNRTGLRATSPQNGDQQFLAQQEGPSDDGEGARFLRMAHEALVSTATGISSDNAGLIDPTIQDLLKRLQYASVTHARRQLHFVAEKQERNKLVPGFYDTFPNFNDSEIFPYISLSHQPYDRNNSQPQKNNADLRGFSPPEHQDSVWSTIENSIIGLQPQKMPTSHEDISLATSASKLFPISSSKEGDRKFFCAKCSMCFRRSSDLKRHEKQHLSIPANICSYCGKGFARKDALKRHMGTLTCKRNAEKELYSLNLEYLRADSRQQQF